MVAVMVIIVRVAVVIVMAVIMAAAVVIAPGKGSGKNPKKSSPRKKGRFTLGFLMQNGVCIGVIGIPINISPA